MSEQKKIENTATQDQHAHTCPACGKAWKCSLALSPEQIEAFGKIFVLTLPPTSRKHCIHDSAPHHLRCG